MSGAQTGSRDDRTVRRGLLAGAGTALVAGCLFGFGLSGGGATAAVAGAWLGIALGGFVTAGWLLVALGLDVVAGQRPPRARLLWTAGATLLALVLPMVALAAAAASTS